MRPLRLSPLLSSCSALLLLCACTPNATGGGGTAGAATGTDTGAVDPATGGSPEAGTDTAMTAADSESSGGTTAVCGNGIVESGEDCDASGESATCNANCMAASCGDGIVNTTAGEDCDDAANGDDDDGCTDACFSPRCGDGILQVSRNEECDDSGASQSCTDACFFKSWGEPTILGTPADSSPAVLVHDNGNAMVIWRTSNSVEAARYDAATDTWGRPFSLPDPEMRPTFAMDESENVIAVWDSMGDVYSARYDAGAETWSKPQLLETDVEWARPPGVAVAGNGDAVAAWRQNTNDEFNVYASRYEAATNSWSPREPVQIPNDNASTTSVAIDDSGNAIVVWAMRVGAWNSTYASRYSVLAENWSDPVALEEVGMGHASSTRVAVDEAGNALAVWRKSDGTRTNLHVARYDVLADNWDESELLEDDDIDVVRHRVAFDQAGNAIAAWSHTTALSTSFSRAKHYDAATGTWGAVVSLSEDSLVDDLAVGQRGTAVVTLGAGGVGREAAHVQTIRYNATAGSWGAAEALEMSDEDAVTARVGIAGNGNLVATWIQTDGASQTAVASVFN